MTTVSKIKHLLLPRVANAHQIKGGVIGGNGHGPLQLRVVECTDGHAAEIQRYSLQQQVLRRMPDFQVYITRAACLPVPLRRA